MRHKGIQQEYPEIDRWAVRPAFAGLGVLCAGLFFAFCYGALGITPVRRWFTALHPQIFMFFRNAWGNGDAGHEIRTTLLIWVLLIGLPMAVIAAIFTYRSANHAGRERQAPKWLPFWCAIAAVLIMVVVIVYAGLLGSLGQAAG